MIHDPATVRSELTVDDDGEDGERAQAIDLRPVLGLLIGLLLLLLLVRDLLVVVEGHVHDVVAHHRQLDVPEALDVVSTTQGVLAGGIDAFHRRRGRGGRSEVLRRGRHGGDRRRARDFCHTAGPAAIPFYTLVTRNEVACDGIF